MNVENERELYEYISKAEKISTESFDKKIRIAKSAYLKKPNSPRFPAKLIMSKIFFLDCDFEFQISFATK